MQKFVNILKILRTLLIIGIIVIPIIICLFHFIRAALVDSYIQFLQLEPIKKYPFKLLTEIDITNDSQTTLNFLQNLAKISKIYVEDLGDKDKENLDKQIFFFFTTIISGIYSPILALSVLTFVPGQYIFYKYYKRYLYISAIDLFNNKAYLMQSILYNFRNGFYIFVLTIVKRSLKKFNLSNFSEEEKYTRFLALLKQDFVNLNNLINKDDSQDLPFKNLLNSKIEYLYCFYWDDFYFILIILIVLLLLVILITVIIRKVEKMQ